MKYCKKKYLKWSSEQLNEKPYESFVLQLFVAYILIEHQE